MSGLRTEYPFVLPKGFVDGEGNLHREGTMRLATARDELEPLADPKVKGADDPYLTVIVLARVVTGIGTLTRLSPRDVEGMFAADLAHLQDVYSVINYGTSADIDAMLAGQRGARTAPLAPATTPLSVAAAAPAVAPAPAAADDEAPAPAALDGGDDPDLTGLVGSGGDEELALPKRPPRRARIEEVGRSVGRPGGA
ncbi:MAG: hypothetical protein WD378_04210 [Egicoccus sp.]